MLSPRWTSLISSMPPGTCIYRYFSYPSSGLVSELISHLSGNAASDHWSRAHGQPCWTPCIHSGEISRMERYYWRRHRDSLHKGRAHNERNGIVFYKIRERELHANGSVTCVQIYWVSGCITSSMRLYYEQFHPMKSQANLYVSAPTAVAVSRSFLFFFLHFLRALRSAERYSRKSWSFRTAK